MPSAGGIGVWVFIWSDAMTLAAIGAVILFQLVTTAANGDCANIMYARSARYPCKQLVIIQVLRVFLGTCSASM
jgi:hypothetical protein